MPKIELPDAPAATMEPPKVEAKRPPGSKPERKKSLLEDALMRNNPKPADVGDPVEYLPPIKYEIEGELVMEEKGYGQPDQIRIASDKYKGRPQSQVSPDDTPSWPLSSLLYEWLANAAQVDFNSLVDQVAMLQADRGGHLDLGKIKIAIEFSALKE